MKKIISMFLFIPAVLLLLYVPASATVMKHIVYVPGYESGYDLIGNPDAIYQNNLAFMESRTMDPEKIKLFLQPSRQIFSNDKEIIELANTLTGSLQDSYSKAKALHDWVCANIYYDFDDTILYDEEGAVIDKQATDFVLKNRRGKCEGYANLYCALLRAAGIPAQVYGGLACSGNNWVPHAWTLVYISEQNRWINVDCTWDSLNTYEKGEYKSRGTRDYYFDVDIKTLSADHIVAPTIFDDLYFNPESEEDTARRFGKDANLDFKRTDLYFYHENVSMSKHFVIQFRPGYGPWSLQQYFDQSWVSSNPEVATVDQLGNVTPHNYGTTTISLALLERGMVASFELVVEPQEFGVFCPPLTVGQTYAASAYWLGDISYNWQMNMDYYTWESSNPEVAVVDSQGKVTAVGPGTTFIIMKSKDGLETAQVEVNVKPPIEAIHLNVKNLVLQPGESFIGVSVNGSPEEYYPNSVGMMLEFESSNPQVAQIVSGRRIDAISEGTAIITAKLVRYENGVKVVKLTDTCVVTVAYKAEEKAAIPTSSMVMINGKTYQFDAYNIDGSNYFKLRDLAMALNGTGKSFEVAFDETSGAIHLSSGKAYTPVGGELKMGDGKEKNAVKTSSAIYKDGSIANFTAYNINGNNYFKLRDVAQAFDFGVSWDGAANTIVIDASQSYMP